MNANRYPHLFVPLEVHGVSIRNRFVMGSIHSGLEDRLFSFKKLAAYLGERAKGGVGLIITGGIAPNLAGRVSPFGGQLSSFLQVPKHRQVTRAVHREGAKIVMQILHAGRYAYHPFLVAPSAIQSPITPFKPKALSARGVQKTIDDFANTAKLAESAGYDGVEVMGSEGYLLHQFVAARTNHRKDQWGGSFENRMRFPLEIVRAIRARVKKEFLIIFRISLLDLIQDGGTWEEAVAFAKELEKAGVSILNTGIGWHEARVPTIATVVPRAAYAFPTARLKKEVSIPVIAVNRINTPELAEKIVAEGTADLISMARPFLADPDLVKKAAEGRVQEINTCIACNQACLDHTFVGKRSTCLVNPRAAFEDEFRSSEDLRQEVLSKANGKKKLAVVGAGPAGLSAAISAAELGHSVTLFEATDHIGGQFDLAKEIPGKEEFRETIRYYKTMLEKTGVTVKLGTSVAASDLISGQFDSIAIATGVKPRDLRIPGSDLPHVIRYPDAIRHPERLGRRVAVIGAGGIGFDVARLLMSPERSVSLDGDRFLKHWGIDPTLSHAGGMDIAHRELQFSNREVTLLQRSVSKFGERLGKTTGWIHRLELKEARVKMRAGVTYVAIEKEGIRIRTEKGGEELVAVDQIVVCAGQESVNGLESDLKTRGFAGKVAVLGGAKLAAEIDAKRAIRDGFIWARGV